MSVSWSLKRSYAFSREFQDILRFYLLNCPIKDVSKRKEFSDIKEAPARERKRAMMNSSALNETTWQMKSSIELESFLEEFGVLRSFNPDKEFAIHIRSRNLNQPLALIYMIRCALAHGSFSQRSHKGYVYYAFENQDRGRIKGRAVLKEETLLKWIRIFKHTVK